MEPTNSAKSTTQAQIGRNEPCPCGSGRKYKRCHGQDAAPKVTAPSTPTPNSSPVPAFDPNQMDPAQMAQVAQMLQRLPKAQLIRMQGLMQKAMSGKDVNQELASLQASLPPAFQQALMGLAPQMAGMGDPAPPSSEAEARKIIEAAVTEGRMTQAEADAALGPRKGFWSKFRSK